MTAAILIVEDEPLLAMAMGEQLRECGFDVAGVAPTVAKALSLIGSRPVDAAILDCNLRGQSVEDLALALSQRGIPFIFHSGYAAGQICERFKNAPFLSKPVAGDVLAGAVRKLLGR